MGSDYGRTPGRLGLLYRPSGLRSSHTAHPASSPFPSYIVIITINSYTPTTGSLIAGWLLVSFFLGALNLLPVTLRTIPKAEQKLSG